MKIAYIILFHKNFEQTNLLVNQLDDGNCDFFVYVDKKIDVFVPFDSSRVFFVPNESRFDVKWGTISMVSATINAMKLVRGSNTVYDYVFLLSGQDFPIKSNVEIQRFLAKNGHSNFIELINHSDKTYSKCLKRNSLNYHSCMMRRSFFSRLWKKLYIYRNGRRNKNVQNS